MSDHTTHTLPAYLSYSMGLLWLWSGTQPLFFMPEMSMAAAIDNRRGIQPDHCLQTARNVGASICAFGKKSADYGYFIFPVSIRRR